MNSEQAVLIVAALESATRAGFTVTIGPTLPTGRASVAVNRRFILAGKATSRVEPFTVVRDSVRDALGNALGVLTLEIGADRLRQEQALADEEAIADRDPILSSDRDLRPAEAR